jgi:hypothetical protein
VYAVLLKTESAGLPGWRFFATETLIITGLCLLLTDIFFLYVKAIPFTGKHTSEQPNLAVVLMKFFAIFPAAVLLPLAVQAWIETSFFHIGVTAAIITVAHLKLRAMHRDIVNRHTNLIDLDDEEEEFPLRLGLRY